MERSGNKSVQHNVCLDDDKENGHPGNFVGATLPVGGGQGETQVTFAGTGVKRSDSQPPSMNRDRPGSTIGRKSTVSVGSRTSASSRIVISDRSKDFFFSRKGGSFENAVEHCSTEIFKADLDGELRGAWLLSEIDHWDHEFERMVLLSDRSCFVVNYDFITLKMKGYKRIALKDISTIQCGDFVYPEKSLMRKISPRDHGGVRIFWGDPSGLTFGQRWNPFTSDIPLTTFAHHPLLYNHKECETITYNVDDFVDSLEQAVRRARQMQGVDGQLVVKQEPLLVESYLSISSLVFNQSFLGFNRDRNGVSF